LYLILLGDCFSPKEINEIVDLVKIVNEPSEADRCGYSALDSKRLSDHLHKICSDPFFDFFTIFGKF